MYNQAFIIRKARIEALQRRQRVSDAQRAESAEAVSENGDTLTHNRLKKSLVEKINRRLTHLKTIFSEELIQAIEKGVANETNATEADWLSKMTPSLAELRETVLVLYANHPKLKEILTFQFDRLQPLAEEATLGDLSVQRAGDEEAALRDPVAQANAAATQSRLEENDVSSIDRFPDLKPLFFLDNLLAWLDMGSLDRDIWESNITHLLKLTQQKMTIEAVSESEQEQVDSAGVEEYKASEDPPLYTLEELKHLTPGTLGILGSYHTNYSHKQAGDSVDPSRIFLDAQNTLQTTHRDIDEFFLQENLPTYQALIDKLKRILAVDDAHSILSALQTCIETCIAEASEENNKKLREISNCLEFKSHYLATFNILKQAVSSTSKCIAPDFLQLQNLLLKKTGYGQEKFQALTWTETGGGNRRRVTHQELFVKIEAGLVAFLQAQFMAPAGKYIETPETLIISARLSTLSTFRYNSSSQREPAEELLHFDFIKSFREDNDASSICDRLEPLVGVIDGAQNLIESNQLKSALKKARSYVKDLLKSRNVNAANLTALKINFILAKMYESSNQLRQSAAATLNTAIQKAFKTISEGVLTEEQFITEIDELYKFVESKAPTSASHEEDNNDDSFLIRLDFKRLFWFVEGEMTRLTSKARSLEKGALNKYRLYEYQKKNLASLLSNQHNLTSTTFKHCIGQVAAIAHHKRFESTLVTPQSWKNFLKIQFAKETHSSWQNALTTISRDQWDQRFLEVDVSIFYKSYNQMRQASKASIPEMNTPLPG